MSKRIEWSYKHWLNGHAFTRRTKRGEYYGKIRHTIRHWNREDSVQMALVKFDGNKRSSKVPFDELTFL